MAIDINIRIFTDIAQKYQSLQDEYGSDDAIYPFLEWVKKEQDRTRYAIKESVIFIKLEIGLAHLISMREIKTFEAREKGIAPDKHTGYQHANGEIEAFIRNYTRIPKKRSI